MSKFKHCDEFNECWLSADLAKEITEDHRRFDYILNQILEVAKTGRYYFNRQFWGTWSNKIFKDSLTERVIRKLEFNGYKIEYDDNGEVIEISWD